MAERARRKAPVPLVVCEIDPPMLVYFTRAVIAERDTFRRLAHRIVDLAVDRGRLDWLRGEVADGLGKIARDRVVKKVTKFVQEARAEGKEARGG